MLVYSLQGGQKIGFEKLRGLCYTKSIDDVRQLSHRFLKAEIFFNDEGELKSGRNIDNYIYGHIKDEKYSERNTIGVLLSFIFILEIAIKDLIAITEGIRYSLPKPLLRQFLIYPGR